MCRISVANNYCETTKGISEIRGTSSSAQEPCQLNQFRPKRATPIEACAWGWLTSHECPASCRQRGLIARGQIQRSAHNASVSSPSECSIFAGGWFKHRASAASHSAKFSRSDVRVPARRLCVRLAFLSNQNLPVSPFAASEHACGTGHRGVGLVRARRSCFACGLAPLEKNADLC